MKEMTVTPLYEIVAGMNKQFMDYYNSGDAAGLAELYTDDGQILPPNSGFVTGRTAIEAFWEALMEMGIKQVKLEVVEVERGPDTAYEMSTFILADANGQTLDQGKYIVIWKQEDGDWKLHRDIFNSSTPVS